MTSASSTASGPRPAALAALLAAPVTAHWPTENSKLPSVRCVSTETTCHLTRYRPDLSCGKGRTSAAGLYGSMAAAPVATGWPAAVASATPENDGSIGSLKNKCKVEGGIANVGP